MKKIIFITGPVRSGKSDFAVRLAKKRPQKVVFLATCKPADDEMNARVKTHRQNRPKDWRLIEEAVNISSVVKKGTKGELIIIDCLTLWISNLLLSGLTEKEIGNKINEFTRSLTKTKSAVIIVSNEVGWGIVPDNKLARIFREISGRLHRKLAEISAQSYLLVAGIPLKLKG